MEGTPFGRYRLIELLGRGGMGEVWRAHDTGTDRIVAIKVLPAHFSDNEEFQRRFRREAHAASRLNTPHVVPIHDYGEIDGRLYVNMRLVEGRDLETVLAEGPMEPARAVRIIEGVALALHAAHKVGLLHRDVKPSNILLDENDFAYLIDFGIARAADETRLTKSGYAAGTFQYIAPERLGTRAEEDARADIYSLACVLYECLIGRPPFAGDTIAGLVAAHLNTPPPQPSATQPNVPAQFDEVIATGMAKAAKDRYASAGELARAAHQALSAPDQDDADTILADTQAATGDRAQTVSAGNPPASSPTSTQAADKDRTRRMFEWLGFGDSPAEVFFGPDLLKLFHRLQQARTGTKIMLLAVTVLVVVLVGVGITIFAVVREQHYTSQTSNALEGLLLSPDQINTAMGATGMTVSTTITTMLDASAHVAAPSPSRRSWVHPLMKRRSSNSTVELAHIEPNSGAYRVTWSYPWGLPPCRMSGRLVR